MTIFGKSRDLKTKNHKTQAARIHLSLMELMPKGRVNSNAKTDLGFVKINVIEKTMMSQRL